ncbi:MAG: lipoxygenase family protein [Acidobacteriota bacterium]
MSKKDIGKLPLRILGFRDMPAVPVDVLEVPRTLAGLTGRAGQTKQSTHGLSNTYTIQGITAPAYPFLFGSKNPPTSAEDAESGESTGFGAFISEAKEAVEDLVEEGVSHVKDALVPEKPDIAIPTHRADLSGEARENLLSELMKDPAKAAKRLEDAAQEEEELSVASAESPDPWTNLSLEDPAQFSMAWTTFPDAYSEAMPLLDSFVAPLRDAEAATKAFWPTLSRYGLPLNLVILNKVRPADVDPLKLAFGTEWSAEMDELASAGLLYSINMSIFESTKPRTAKGATRFTPATITLLSQDSVTLELEPIAVKVSGYKGSGAQIFTPGGSTSGAWIYALQAARTSITVWGIWLGHVYHWHMVVASMQRSMYNEIDSEHSIRLLLDPQSDHLIGFDQVLLLLWGNAAPPTAITSSRQFLNLTDAFAGGQGGPLGQAPRRREFFDDDPITALEAAGIREEDFSKNEPWDRYPVIGQLLSVWRSTERFVDRFVELSYSDDEAVQEDEQLQAWITDAGKGSGGNVFGLPEMNSRKALQRVLTSMVYRVTVHGSSRLVPSANPGLSFVGNFPPTLHSAQIPAPGATIDTEELMAYLPQTGVIGGMVTFLFTFSFSAPYDPLIPVDGLDTELYFPDGDPRNEALLELRREIVDFMTAFYGEGHSPVINQWPRGVET